MQAKKRIAFFCGPDRRFLPDIVDHFFKRTDEYEVLVFHSKSVKDFTDTMAWSDISWFEWCDLLVVEASKLPKVCRMVCRLHGFELSTEMPSQVNWGNVDTLILTAYHIKDTLKAQIPDIEERVDIQVIHNVEDNYPLEKQLRGIETVFNRLWEMDANARPQTHRPGTILRCNVLAPFLKNILKPGQKVLDIGGFDGFLSSRLKDEIGISPVVLDTDLEGLEMAKKRGLETCPASALNMPFDDASFDAALCLDVIEHLQDEDSLLKEIFRILRPGGLLIMTVPVKGAAFASISDDELKKLHESWGHLRPGYELDVIKSLLEGAKFTLEQTTGHFNAESQKAYADLFMRPNIIPYVKRLVLWDRITKNESPSRDGNFEYLLVARKQAGSKKINRE